MSNTKGKIMASMVAGFVIFLLLVYLGVFGRALRQEENHLAILMALPKVVLTSRPQSIGGQMFLSKDVPSFVALMKNQGFVHVEQLGSGHVFEKEGRRYISTSRMYSSYFMIFTHPKEI